MSGLVQYEFSPFPRNRVTLECPPGSSKTRQSEAAECDVNNIIRKWEKSGLVGHVSSQAPAYVDTTLIPDYQSSLEIVIQAQHDFSRLPSRVRERFNNDPGRLLSFLQDSSNRDEALKLGLISPPAAASQPPAAVSAPSASPVPIPENK